MRIVVIADELQKQELFGAETKESILCIDRLDLGIPGDVDAIVDLQFDNTAERLNTLIGHEKKTIIVNSVLYTVKELDKNIVRFNGWNTFLHGPIVEASAASDEIKQEAEDVFQALGKQVEWVPDMIGFIAPRVVSSIINEAYIALQEGISTKEEINTAMKLGTAYPYGPFEWADKITLKNIAALLKKLSIEDERYLPNELLMEAAAIN